MGSLHQVPRKPCQGNHQRGSLVGGGLKSSGPMSFMNKKKTYELVQSRALSAEGLTQVELDSIQSESLNKVEEVQQKSDLAYLKNLETISADIEEKKEIMQLPKLQKDNSAQLQIIDSCRGELQQYKQLRAEVKPWIESFTKENGRQPTIVDVVNTTDVSFQSVYKSYMLLRDKLFTEIPQLRPKLDPNNQTEEPVKKMGGLGNVINCNSADSGQKVAASRFLSALEYKQKHNKVASKESQGGDNKGESLDRMSRLLPAASPRVRKAMMAALDYKKNKQSTQNQKQQSQ